MLVESSVVCDRCLEILFSLSPRISTIAEVLLLLVGIDHLVLDKSFLITFLCLIKGKLTLTGRTVVVFGVVCISYYSLESLGDEREILVDRDIRAKLI